MLPQYYHDYSGARARLNADKSGDAIGALHHKTLGDIDLVWGEEGTGKSDGFGLAKIEKFHPEIVDRLQDIIYDLPVAKVSENRVKLEDSQHFASIRLDFDGVTKHWLLTAFEKEGETANNRTNTAGTLTKADGMTTPSSYDKTLSQPANNVKRVTAMVNQIGLDPRTAKFVVTLFDGFNAASMPHELSHIFRRMLEGEELAHAEKVFGVKDGAWSVKHEEAFANAFVKYLHDGKAPSEVS